MEREKKVDWRSLNWLNPELRIRIVEKAMEFSGIAKIQKVTLSRVTSSHSNFINIFGVDNEGLQIVVGVDPITTEILKLVKLCPRKIVDAKKVEISEDQAISRCIDFLKSRGLSLPKNYIQEKARVASVGPWKRWKLVWRHVENDVKVLSDFIMMEVNASEEADILSYSKVYHDISVDLTPKLNLSDAEAKAKEFMKDFKDFKLADGNLAVVYPNNFFRKQVWEWSEEQALCWILKFSRDGKHAIDIWVSAVTGEIHGGELCHLHTPEVYGIDRPAEDHMQSHLNNIWSPYFDIMKYDTSAFNWTNANAGFSEATITTAISNGRFFIVEGHGDVTTTAEMMAIAYQGTVDARALTPDEVPSNNLRFAFLDVCQSGEDGTGFDFKDTFISQGGDVFVGFDDYMCAWNYEERLLYYLAQGIHLANSHSLAVADVSPWYKIVITYNVACLNKVRLAPLLVTVERSPSGSISKLQKFTVTASINNREDVDHTLATNVKAKLILPTGFNIISGANPQNIGNASWNSPKTAKWIVKAPNTSGMYTLDVEVVSDNLGVAVDNPDDPYHKFEVNVTGGLGWWW